MVTVMLPDELAAFYEGRGKPVEDAIREAVIMFFFATGKLSAAKARERLGVDCEAFLRYTAEHHVSVADEPASE